MDVEGNDRFMSEETSAEASCLDLHSFSRKMEYTTRRILQASYRTITEEGKS
jgi:hypothetical protein